MLVKGQEPFRILAAPPRAGSTHGDLSRGPPRGGTIFSSVTRRADFWRQTSPPPMCASSVVLSHIFRAQTLVGGVMTRHRLADHHPALRWRQEHTHKGEIIVPASLAADGARIAGFLWGDSSTWALLMLANFLPLPFHTQLRDKLP